MLDGSAQSRCRPGYRLLLVPPSSPPPRKRMRISSCPAFGLHLLVGRRGAARPGAGGSGPGRGLSTSGSGLPFRGNLRACGTSATRSLGRDRLGDRLGSLHRTAGPLIHGQRHLLNGCLGGCLGGALGGALGGTPGGTKDGGGWLGGRSVPRRRCGGLGAWFRGSSRSFGCL